MYIYIDKYIIHTYICICIYLCICIYIYVKFVTENVIISPEYYHDYKFITDLISYIENKPISQIRYVQIFNVDVIFNIIIISILFNNISNIQCI